LKGAFSFQLKEFKDVLSYQFSISFYFYPYVNSSGAQESAGDGGLYREQSMSSVFSSRSRYISLAASLSGKYSN